MKTLRPQRRSISPFGQLPKEEGPFDRLKDSYQKLFPEAPSQDIPKKLKTWVEAPFIPRMIEKVGRAVANETVGLANLCTYLVQVWSEIEQRRLETVTLNAMENLFNQKTEVFLVDHHDKDACEKMEWKDAYRDNVLFSKERDILVGRFFGPLTEKYPDEFKAFIDKWVSTENPDRILHFLDFCSGAKRPTFEHHLLLTHPAITAVVENKALVQALFEKAKPLLAKLSSPTWETDTRNSLFPSL